MLIRAVGCVRTGTGLACAAQWPVRREHNDTSSVGPGMGASRRASWSARFMDLVVGDVSLAPCPVRVGSSSWPTPPTGSKRCCNAVAPK